MSIYIQKKLCVRLVGVVFLMIFMQKTIANDQDTRPSELAFANKQLNEIYKKIFNKLHLSDQIKLKIAQRQWIHFRDLDCTWAFSAEPIDCMIDRTENRSKELEETNFFGIDGRYSTIANDNS